MAMLELIAECRKLGATEQDIFNKYKSEILNLLQTKKSKIEEAIKHIKSLESLLSAKDPALAGSLAPNVLTNYNNEIVINQNICNELFEKIANTKNYQELISALPKVTKETNFDCPIIFGTHFNIEKVKAVWNAKGCKYETVSTDEISTIFPNVKKAAEQYASEYNAFVREKKIEQILKKEILLTLLPEGTFKELQKELNGKEVIDESDVARVLPHLKEGSLNPLKISYNKLMAELKEVTNNKATNVTANATTNTYYGIFPELKQIAEATSQDWNGLVQKYEALDKKIDTCLTEFDRAISNRIYSRAIKELYRETANLPPKERVQEKIGFWLDALATFQNIGCSKIEKFNFDDSKVNAGIIETGITDKDNERIEKIKERKIAEAKERAYQNWLNDVVNKLADVANSYGIKVDKETLKGMLPSRIGDDYYDETAKAVENIANTIIYWLNRPAVKTYITELAQRGNTTYDGCDGLLPKTSGAQKIANYILQEAKRSAQISEANQLTQTTQQ